MSVSSDFSYLSTVELASIIRDRQVSSREVVDYFLRRIDERDKSLHAFVHRGFDEALERAEQADAKLGKGVCLGPLHGVPTAIKDLVDTKAGWPSTAGGIRALKGNIAKDTSLYTRKLEDAGAIILGMTNAPVMGFRGTTDNLLFGPTSNPFDIRKNSGGSSGGSAAAVADGMLPFAQGTDGGGSIRIPASWCGVYGFQASFGRIPFVSRPNAFGGDSPFLYCGPITRTVADAALVLSVVAGYDSRDPYSIVQTCDFSGALEKSVAGARVAYSPNLDVFPVDSEVREVLDSCVADLRLAGMEVDEVDLGIELSHNLLSDAWIKLILPFALMVFDGMKNSGVDIIKDHPSDIPPELTRWLEFGAGLSAVDICKLQEVRTHIFDALQDVFDKYDYLITPTMACLPVNNSNDGNTLGPDQINGVRVDNLIGYCMTYFTNFTGHPAASIPAGLSASGMPVGMQIIGKRYGDEDLLAVSSFIEKIRPWRGDYSICEDREIAQ